MPTPKHRRKAAPSTAETFRRTASPNRHQRRKAEQRAFREGVTALGTEAQGVVKTIIVRPEDYVEMLADMLNGRLDHIELLDTVSGLVARINKARTAGASMLCAACPAELTGGFAVVVATANDASPKHGMGLFVCTSCGTDLPTIKEAALEGLRRLWPDMRPITIHGQAGRA